MLTQKHSFALVQLKNRNLPSSIFISQQTVSKKVTNIEKLRTKSAIVTILMEMVPPPPLHYCYLRLLLLPTTATTATTTAPTASIIVTATIATNFFFAWHI